MDNKKIDKIIKILKKDVKKFRTPIVTEVSERRNPFLVLISCILSLRTKDKTTSEASARLFKLAKTPEKMAELRTKQIENAIYPVGFYITKAERIKEICKVLIKKYNSRVPDEIDELLKLKGVGRKTANLVVGLGYNKPAICVDTHVHCISNRLGYVKTKNPHETEFSLRKKLPRKHWIIYNDLLVAWGQNICVSVSPWCSRCHIAKYCKKAGIKKSR